MKVNKEILTEICFDDVCSDDPYEVIEDGDWVDDGKVSFKDVVFKFEDKFYMYSFSRSGSYHTDYYYNVEDLPDDGDDVIEVKQREFVVKKWVSIDGKITAC